MTERGHKQQLDNTMERQIICDGCWFCQEHCECGPRGTPAPCDLKFSPPHPLCKKCLMADVFKPNPNGLGGVVLDTAALARLWDIPHPAMEDEHGRPCYLPDGTRIKYNDRGWWFWRKLEAYSPEKHGSLEFKRRAS